MTPNASATSSCLPTQSDVTTVPTRPTTIAPRPFEHIDEWRKRVAEGGGGAVTAPSHERSERKPLTKHVRRVSMTSLPSTSGPSISPVLPPSVAASSSSLMAVIPSAAGRSMLTKAPGLGTTLNKRGEVLVTGVKRPRSPGPSLSSSSLHAGRGFKSSGGRADRTSLPGHARQSAFSSAVPVTRVPAPLTAPPPNVEPVSYTHLTLPTIYSV